MFCKLGHHQALCYLQLHWYSLVTVGLTTPAVNRWLNPAQLLREVGKYPYHPYTLELNAAMAEVIPTPRYGIVRCSRV